MGFKNKKQTQIVLYYACSNIKCLVLIKFVILCSFSPRCEVVTILSTILLVFNSSINIIIYCWKNKSFRKVLLSKLRIADLAKECRSSGNKRWIFNYEVFFYSSRSQGVYQEYENHDKVGYGRGDGGQQEWGYSELCITY